MEFLESTLEQITASMDLDFDTMSRNYQNKQD